MFDWLLFQSVLLCVQSLELFLFEWGIIGGLCVKFVEFWKIWKIFKSAILDSFIHYQNDLYLEYF